MRTNYEQLAGRYDEDRARWPIPRDDVVDELLASRPVIRVLDLGCGTGRWLGAQRDLIGGSSVRLFGADPSSAMLAQARAKGIGAILRARAEDLPLQGGAVDYITSSYAFHHFSDKERALDEVCRVLAPVGVFRINNIDPAAAEGWWVYEFFPEAIAMDAVRFWSAGRIADALEARGLTVDMELEAGTEEVPACEALADAERRVLSQLALLDDDSYTRGLARLARAAAVPGATLTTIRSRLCLTARRTR